jgi:hypothetical protein
VVATAVAEEDEGMVEEYSGGVAEVGVGFAIADEQEVVFVHRAERSPEFKAQSPEGRSGGCGWCMARFLFLLELRNPFVPM